MPKSRELIEATYRAESSGSFLRFVGGLVINAAGGPKRFMRLMRPFQEQTFLSLAPSLHAIRDGAIPKKRRFWIERTKKAGKDSDLAVCILWLMAFPKRPSIKIQICAANRQQAGIIRGRILDLLNYNPWLNDLVEVKQYLVVCKAFPRTVWTRIESTQTDGAGHGETPDLLILNELVHVARWQAMNDHMSNADGTPNSVVIISTNAGIQGTSASAWRENALSDPERWSIHLWSQMSPWIDPKDVEDAKRRDPVGAHHKRLFEGKWISGTGGAVTEEALNDAFVMDGPITSPRSGMEYVAGLDLGVTHDHSGIAVLEVDVEQGKARTACVLAFEPSIKNSAGGLEVDLQAVEEACVQVAQTYNISWFGFDPAAGGFFMAQRLRPRDIPMWEIKFSSPSVQTQMATTFVQMFNDRQFECYDDGEGRLRRDFGKFHVENRVPTGHKLTAVRDQHGHADVGVAVVIAMLRAKEILGGGVVTDWSEDAVLAYGPDEQKELSEEEWEEMPDDLKEIIEVSTRDEEGRPLKKKPRILKTYEECLEELYNDEDAAELAERLEGS